MLILPNSCFLHVPKTGGSWVRKAIIASGIRCQEYQVNGDFHIGLAQCPCPDKFKFAFVRHPLDLYRSYWQYKMSYGWDPKNQMDMACRSDNFHQFVCHVLDKYPGVYGKSLIEIIGENGNEIEFIGKYENLVEDLITALNRAGEVFDEHAIRTFPPFNVSDKVKFPADYTELLKNRVIEAEMMVMNRFYA